MYSREFPSGNFLFFIFCKTSLFRLPRGKFPLSFLAVPASKDSRVERPCQTVNDFIGVSGNVCGLFLFVQTHAPLTVPPWQSRARESKFQFLIRRKGADVFCPALAAGGSLMAYKCLSLCDFFIVQHFFKLCHIRFTTTMPSTGSGSSSGLFPACFCRLSAAASRCFWAGKFPRSFSITNKTRQSPFRKALPGLFLCFVQWSSTFLPVTGSGMPSTARMMAMRT